MQYRSMVYNNHTRYIVDSLVVGVGVLWTKFLIDVSLSMLQYDVVQHNEIKLRCVTFWEHIFAGS